MTPTSSQDAPRRRFGERYPLLKAAREVSEAIGAEFFSILVHQLCDSLGAECVYVGELLSGKTCRVRTMAAWGKPNRSETLEFPLVGSPESQIVSGNSCLYSWGVRNEFPEHPLLRDLQIESYIGVPLNDSEGHVCGVIAALFREQLDLEISFVQAMLNIFVPRASAELNRKRADDALRLNEQRYRTFVELNPDACWRVEFDLPIDTSLSEREQVEEIFEYGRLTEANQALAQKMGLDHVDRIIGKPMAEAMRDMQNAQTCMQTLVRSGYRHSTLEVTTVWQNKRSHFVHSFWGMVENGRLLRIWGSSRDVTELRELEVQFRHVQKMESLGRLAAGVAHDFNNLLIVIQNVASEMLLSADVTNKAYVGIREIQKTVDKGCALTRQLLAFGYRQAVDLQVLDLNRVVADAERMLRHLLSGNIELIVEIAASPARVRTDSGYMQQVLMNLATNARDAMPNGGRLGISVANIDIAETCPTQAPSIKPGPYVRLSVADSGHGMAPDIEEHLFEPFFTTKEKGRGTGLGLSTVYGIVRQLDGYIAVETELNRGTRFDIFFPRLTGTVAR